MLIYYPTFLILNRYPQAENPPHKQHIYFFANAQFQRSKNKRAVFIQRLKIIYLSICLNKKLT